MIGLMKWSLHWAIAATIAASISWLFMVDHTSDDSCESKCTQRLEAKILHLESKVKDLEAYHYGQK